jgi:5-methylcytosine-specific restriction endonuclease McrA
MTLTTPNQEELRLCEVCESMLPLSSFYCGLRDGYAARCRPCERSDRLWKRDAPEEYKKILAARKVAKKARLALSAVNVLEKTCTKCGLLKPLEAFRDGRNGDRNGKKSWCRECDRLASKIYAEANREKVREADRRRWAEKFRTTEEKATAAKRTRIWAQANSERLIDYRKGYYRANSEALKRQSKEWYDANKERAQSLSKAWRDAHPDKMRTYLKNWRLNASNKLKKSISFRAWALTHPNKMREYYRRWYIKNQAVLRVSQRERQVLYATSDFDSNSWQRILTYFGHCCAYCLRKDEPLTMDHMVPISKGGSHTEDNVVPACKSCNSKKGNRPIFLMANRLADFSRG